MSNSLFLSSLYIIRRKVDPSPRAPFSLSSCYDGSLRKSRHAAKVSFKALPLATDKIAEHPPDLLSKKLARNFLPRSAQLLSELIKKDRHRMKIAIEVSRWRKSLLIFFPATTASKMPLQMYTCMCVCSLFYKCVHILNFNLILWSNKINYYFDMIILLN